MAPVTWKSRGTAGGKKIDNPYARAQQPLVLVREEARDISPDELKQAAKELALATLKNAPALVNAAHQARLLS